MSYVLKSSPRGKDRFPLSLKIALAILAMVVILHIFFPTSFSTFFLSLARPFWNLEKEVKYGENFVNISELISENEQLKKKLAENEARYLQVDLIYKENLEFKKIFDREREEDFVLAQILKKPPFSAYDIFVLDIGSKQEVEIGDRIYASGSVPLGEIVEVSTNISKAKLYSSSGEKYTVLIGDNHIETTATGKGGGSFEASVPRDTKILKGDHVIIPSLFDSFLGTVQDIISIPSNPFSTVLFNQPLNIYELRFVEVDTATIKEK